MTRNILIALLRNDLRLHDHPIFHLCSDPSPPNAHFHHPVTHVLPVYVWDQRHVEVSGFPRIHKADRDGGGKGQGHMARTRTLGLWRCGVHRTKFINESVFDLRDRLRSVGSDLAMFAGTPESVVPTLVKTIRKNRDRVEAVYLGREINTEEVNVQRRLHAILSQLECPFELFEGKALINSSHLGFPIHQLPHVFTHFRKQVEAPHMFRPPVEAPERIKPFPSSAVQVEDAKGVYGVSTKTGEGYGTKHVVETCLLKPLLDDPVLGHELVSEQRVAHSAFPFNGGEREALARLEHYFSGGSASPAASYNQTRNGMLGLDYSTKFGAALAHGLLSPRLIASKAIALDEHTHSSRKGGGYWILFELLWRDYFYYVGCKFGCHLFTLGGIQHVLSPKSAHSKASTWNTSTSLADPTDPFVRWATAKTGVPFIDANMRELVHTGFMSNRGRQNVASFLTKDLGWNWQQGAEFFESWLVDYDPNSNWANWQYVAGVGNDPRSSTQFNPIKQGYDYDPNAEYVATWIAELETLDQSYRHHPWTLQSWKHAQYPSTPIVEHQMWRNHYSNPGGVARANPNHNTGRGGGATHRGAHRRRRGNNNKPARNDAH